MGMREMMAGWFAEPMQGTRCWRCTKKCIPPPPKAFHFPSRFAELFLQEDRPGTRTHARGTSCELLAPWGALIFTAPQCLPFDCSTFWLNIKAPFIAKLPDLLSLLRFCPFGLCSFPFQPAQSEVRRSVTRVPTFQPG